MVSQPPTGSSAAVRVPTHFAMPMPFLAVSTLAPAPLVCTLRLRPPPPTIMHAHDALVSLPTIPAYILSARGRIKESPASVAVN
eukprot:364804-Chlamydomonas_euryale.AAC.4